MGVACREQVEPDAANLVDRTRTLDKEGTESSSAHRLIDKYVAQPRKADPIGYPSANPDEFAVSRVEAEG